MQRVRELLLAYAIEDEPVLLLGETGVGRNRLAALCHRASGRRGRLVTAHCPSIPESLFEAEMFGHRHGAFTGAGEGRPGLVQEAEAGTLLLGQPEAAVAGPLEEVEAALRDGASFWDSAWRAFLDRNLDREELRELKAGE